jgi:hypothetical protein
MQGLFSGAFQCGYRMFASQGQQAMQHACADRVALLHHRFGPTPGVFANQPGTIQQVIQIVKPSDCRVTYPASGWVAWPFPKNISGKA